MSNILLIQVPANASAADWQQVQVALSEARSANYPSDVAQQASVAAPAAAPIVPPPVSSPVVTDQPLFCQACGTGGGLHKSDCMYHPNNRPADALQLPPVAPAAPAVEIPPFVMPAGDPTWLDTFVQTNQRLPQGDEISDNYQHILTRLNGIELDKGSEYGKLRASANSAKARAAKAWKAAHKANGQQNQVGAMIATPPSVPAPPPAYVPAVPAPAVVVPPPVPTATPAAPKLQGFRHVTDLTPAQQQAVATYGTGLTTSRQEVIARFMTGQATAEHLQAIPVKGGRTFYDKVLAVAQKAS